MMVENNHPKCNMGGCFFFNYLLLYKDTIREKIDTIKLVNKNSSVTVMYIISPSFVTKLRGQKHTPSQKRRANHLPLWQLLGAVAHSNSTIFDNFCKDLISLYS